MVDSDKQQPTIDGSVVAGKGQSPPPKLTTNLGRRVGEFVASEAAAGAAA
jgi:hypothetical protein